MTALIDRYLRRQWRPVVDIEHGTTQEIDEPRPVSALVVVSRDVEAKPCTAVGHVVLKGFALLRRVGKIVEPDDELDVLKLGGIHVVPVRRGIQREIPFLREVTVKANRLQSEVDVVLFALVGIKGERVEWRVLGALLCRTSSREQDYVKANYKSAKSTSLLLPERSDVAPSPGTAFH